jgi:hypothetical protein
MPDGGLDLGLDFTNPNTLALLGMRTGSPAPTSRT